MDMVTFLLCGGFVCADGRSQQPATSPVLASPAITAEIGAAVFGAIETTRGTKVRQEIDQVGQPLANLVSSRSLRGLGVDDTSASNAPLYLLGAAGLAALVYLNQ